MRNKQVIIILIFVVGLIYWPWLLNGPRVSTDFSLISQSTLKSLMSLPQTWSVGGTEGLGEYTVFTLWSYPFNFVYGFFANLNIPFEILERILIIVPSLILGGLGILKLSKYLKLSSYAAVVSILFYLTNTYIILVIDGGQLSISMAYALFPLTFLAIERAIVGKLKQKILASLLVSAIGIFDIRFIYIFSLLICIRFLYEFLFLNLNRGFDWVKKGLSLAIVLGAIVAGLNFFWIYILLKDPISSNFYNYLTQTSFESFITLPHAITMMSPHWYKNIFGSVSPLKLEFLFLPFLIFLGPMLNPKNRQMGFWLVVAFISVFLTKGSSEPFGTIYPWLYFHIPGFSLFRDSSKFFFLIALSYTVLIGLTVDGIIRKININKLRVVVSSLIVLYLIILARPAWLGKMYGTFSNPPLQKEYALLNNFISNDKKADNIFWIPTISPLTVLNTGHPSLEAVREGQKRPFAQATLGNYETLNYLREAPYMGELFNVANIGYVVYPPLDLRRGSYSKDQIQYYKTFLSQISNLPWLSRIDNLAIPTFKVKETQDKFFITPNVWWVIGSDNIYNEVTKSTRLSLSKNSLIFAQETQDLGNRIGQLPQSKIILNHKTTLDLAASLIPPEDLIFPAKNLNHDPNVSGWWKRETLDLISWKSFLKAKYGIENSDFDLGGGWAVSEGSLSLNLQNKEINKGNILLSRVLESSRSGEINFYQDQDLIGKINTKESESNVEWFEIGNFKNANNITIKTKGDINVVNALVSISPNLWQQYKDRALSFSQEGRVSDFSELGTEDSSSQINYKQISQTKYVLQIKNLKKPAILVFSQNFDDRWKLNGKSPIPVYSLLNGFSIETNGQYELNFEPQQYVLTGIIVSGITLLSCLILLLV